MRIIFIADSSNKPPLSSLDLFFLKNGFQLAFFRVKIGLFLGSNKIRDREHDVDME